MSQSYAKCIIKHLNTHHVNGQSACTCTYVYTHTVLVECIAWIIQTQVPTIVKPNIHAYSSSLILILHKASLSIPTTSIATSPLQCKGVISGILQYILLQSLCGRLLEEPGGAGNMQWKGFPHQIYISQFYLHFISFLLCRNILNFQCRS